MIHVLKERKCIQLGPTRQPGATDTFSVPKRHHPHTLTQHTLTYRQTSKE